MLVIYCYLMFIWGRTCNWDQICNYIHQLQENQACLIDMGNTNLKSTNRKVKHIDTQMISELVQNLHYIKKKINLTRPSRRQVYCVSDLVTKVYKKTLDLSAENRHSDTARLLSVQYVEMITQRRPEIMSVS